MIVLLGSGALADALATALRAGHRVVRMTAPDGPDAGERLAAARRAGERRPDLVLAAAGEDERSLLLAATARRAGAQRAAAVVRSPELAGSAELAAGLGIDRLIDPEAELAAAAWALVSGPVAAAVHGLGRGRVHVCEVAVPQRSHACGRSLRDLSLPAGSRVALIRRGEDQRADIAPSASSVVHAGDRVLLACNRAVTAAAAATLGAGRDPSGGAVVAVFKGGRGGGAAEALAQRLADIGAPARAMTPVQLRAASRRVRAVVEPESGKDGGLAAVRVRPAGSRGAGVARIDAAGAVARAVEAMLPTGPVRAVGAAVPGELEVYRVQAGRRGEWLGAPLREVPALRGWTVLAIQAGRDAHLPHPDDVIQPGEVLVVLGPAGKASVLRRGLRGGR